MLNLGDIESSFTLKQIEALLAQGSHLAKPEILFNTGIESYFI